MTRKQAFWQGFGWGCVGGLALVALMYLANVFLGLRPLTQLLNEPLLSLMPGFVFGFLIDTLQHAGKVVEEFGLIVAMVIALGVLGGITSLASRRWTSQYLPFALAAIGWIVVVAILLPIGGAGMLGLNDGLATPLMWAALFAIYAVVLQFGAQPAPGVNAGRRRLLSSLPLGIAGFSVLALAYRLGSSARLVPTCAASRRASRRSPISTWSRRTSPIPWSTASRGSFRSAAWPTNR
jgi:hypothetical protein